MKRKFKIFYLVSFIFIAIMLVFFTNYTSASSKTLSLSNKGKSIQIDPTFLNKNLSNAEIIADLKKQGITSIHYMVSTNWNGSKDSLIKVNLIKELQQNGIYVWLMIPATGFYDTQVIDNQQDWLVEFQNHKDYPGMHFYAMNNPGFINWQKEKLANIKRDYGDLFDGIEYAESYYPEYKSLKQLGGDGFYGDVSYFARNNFTQTVFPHSQALTFEQIYQDKVLYSKWINYRANTITTFLADMNEKISQLFPGKDFAVWIMGTTNNNSNLSEMKEYFGIDLNAIIKQVKPSMYVIQTSSQDWGKPYVNPDYTKSYQNLLKEIKSKASNIPVGVQADFVSMKYTNRSTIKLGLNWLNEYMKSSLSTGFDMTTAYGYAVAKKADLWKAYPDDYYISDTPVNAYQEPDIKSAESPRPFDPQIFKIVEKNKQGWLKIQTKSKFCWILNKY